MDVRQRIEVDIKEQELKTSKTIIVGRINSGNTTNYWNCNLHDIVNYGIEIGDYAVVQNKNDFDLIKIIGFLETSDKYSGLICGTIPKKEIVCYLKRKELRED